MRSQFCLMAKFGLGSSLNREVSSEHLSFGVDIKAIHSYVKAEQFVFLYGMFVL